MCRACCVYMAGRDGEDRGCVHVCWEERDGEGKHPIFEW